MDPQVNLSRNSKEFSIDEIHETVLAVEKSEKKLPTNQSLESREKSREELLKEAFEVSLSSRSKPVEVKKTAKRARSPREKKPIPIKDKIRGY